MKKKMIEGPTAVINASLAGVYKTGIWGRIPYTVCVTAGDFWSEKDKDLGEKNT